MERFERYADFEVSGLNIEGTVKGFGQFQLLASEILLAEGLGERGAGGMVVVDPHGWYPLDRYLRAFARTGAKLGDSVLHQLGVGVVKSVEWQPGAETLPGMVRLMDVGYHVHHRRRGSPQPLFDPTTGVLGEGIGHYLGRQVDARTFALECDNPYPCAFDRGLLLGGLRRIQIKAALLHGDDEECRARGGSRCVYLLKQ